MDLLGNYSSSDSDDDDESLNDIERITPSKTDTELIPLPDFEIDETGKGNIHNQIDPKVSVFRNEYEVKKEEERAVLEQHVRLSNSVISSNDTSGKKLCWQFRKHGRCRQGHLCKFAHDTDIFKATPKPPVPLTSSNSFLSYQPSPSPQVEEGEDGAEGRKKKKRKLGLGDGIIPNSKVITVYKDHKKKERSFK